MNNLLRLKSFYLIIYIFIFLVVFINNSLKAEQEFKITSDEITSNKDKKIIDANGNVLIEGKNIKIRSDQIKYNNDTGIIEAEGNIVVQDKFNNHYFFDNLTTNEDFTDAEADIVKSRLKDDSRIVGSKIIKDDNLNVIYDAEYTPCVKENYLIKDCPGWKLKSKKIYHNFETKTLHYDHARIYLFNLPVFYLPYFSHPDPSINKRTGFLMPTIQTDGQLGETLSLPFFYNIAENKDLTFTPNLQSNENNFYELNYRHLNHLGSLQINTSINDNDDNLGTRNHFFAGANINNQYGTLETYIQTTNNDTYMRKMKLNDLTVLKSGINFKKSNDDTYFSLESNAYKHLTRQNLERWEFLYPRVKYNINNIKDDDFGGNVSLYNNFENYKNLENSHSTLASSQGNWLRTDIHSNTGLIFNNEVNFRLVSSFIDTKDSSKDTNKIIFYPQIASKISYPLRKIDSKKIITLTPIIMPIIAPYNNYTEAQTINSSNIFSHNRESSLSKWESGPRVNYGIEWFFSHKNNIDAKISLAQTAKINKEKSDVSDEISDYVLSSSISLSSDKYIANSFIIDRNDIDIKSINTNAFFKYKDIKLALDHDYSSDKYGTGSEQIRVGGKINFKNDFSFNFTGTKDININKNVGYQYGLLYENDCLGIDFNYYRDLTIDRDIKESDGFSFTIVLKPFGSTKKYGTFKTFGPAI